MNGLIFDVSRGCVDDGPGYRTVVFLKGCALDCPWCHNPEGKSFQPEIAFDPAKCLSCGACQAACPRQRAHDLRPPTHDMGLGPRDSKPPAPGYGLRTPDSVVSRRSSGVSHQWRLGCTACGKCAVACPSGARRLAGEEYTVGALVDEVTADLPFFSGTGGGVTFSGGEPMARPDFVFECAKMLRARGIHVAVETAGFWPVQLVRKLVDGVDLILFDIKHVDARAFRKATGKDVSPVLKNLETTLASDLPVELRLTLIPGFNDSAADLKAIAKFLKCMPRMPPVTLQPFHRLAVSKQAIFDCAYPYAGARPVTRKELGTARRTLAREGIKTA
ncbi:MAG: glycyl-radical enzyme activating protein [Deltaproteobacteria bacterium]|nr:glycyl-radical enzyme activating protein [Deltaproteobacteria bacterium]